MLIVYVCGCLVLSLDPLGAYDVLHDLPSGDKLVPHHWLEEPPEMFAGR